MVDKKTGVKPKAKKSRLQAKAPKAQKIETSKKKLVNSETEKTVSSPSKVAPEPLVPSSKLPVTVEPQATTKAGKHSAKALKEAQELATKEARKASKVEAAAAPKQPPPKPRSRVERAGKKYREAAKLIDQSKEYTLPEALQLAVKSSSVKFDATVELHINLGVDPRIADQNVRDNVSLPAGTGKSLRIAVFTENAGIAKANAAGADIAGDADLLSQLEKGEINFDVLITSPQLMARLGKYAKLLGPKGLMPNPKSGTITSDIPKAITQAKGGRVEYRVDPDGIIHLGLGKVSFGPEKLQQNADAVLHSVRAAKPSSIKGNYINSIYLTTTMGPSIKVALEAVARLN